MCNALGNYAPNYIEWFYGISHSFMSSTQLVEPPRHPPMMHDDTFIVPDPPWELVHARAIPDPPFF